MTELPLADRAYYYLCVVLGKLLRAGRYSSVKLVDQDGEVLVRKHRAFYAPLLVSLGGPLVRVLDTGSRVLSHREWVERERELYETLYGASVRIDGDGAILLPHLGGVTLATLLEDPALGDEARRTAIERAVTSLAELHARDVTHADAMAENVLVDLEAGVARWFDFETVHDPGRPMLWRRADDVRALLATCLLRTAPEAFAETLHRIVDAYADDAIVPLLAERFASTRQRALPFHLGQAPLSVQNFREIARLLRERRGG